MSKFTITKLEIENFRSIQNKVTLEIKPGLFAIEGINQDEPGSLNGAGKTTLISALYWCLTGNALTNEVLADDVINSTVGKNCRVTTTITSEENTITIMRTRKDAEHGNNLILLLDEQNLSCHKLTDTQARLNAIIKVPFELLHSTIMMTGDMKSSFSKLTPQQRIQMLEGIRDYSTWDRLREAANTDIKLYNKNAQDLKFKMSTIDGSLNTYTNLVNQQSVTLTALQERVAAQNLDRDIEAIEASKATLVSEVAVAEVALNELLAMTFPNTSDLQAELNSITTTATDLKSELNALKMVDEKDLARRLNTVDSWLKDDTCPTCQQKIIREQATIDAKTAERTSIITAQEALVVKIADKEASLVQYRTKWSTTNQALQNLDRDRVAATTQMNEKRAYIARVNTEIVQKDSSIAQLTRASTENVQKIKALQDTIAEYQQAIADLNTQKQVHTQELETITGKKQLSEYYYKLLGAKGELRPYLLNKDIQYLNACMQKYIARFFDNTAVTLTVEGAAIHIVIDSGGIRKTVASLSGGEEKRLNFSIQLALYDLIQSTAQLSFNALFLDEVESKLDPVGCQQLIEVIEDKTNEIETVYWITNNETVSGSIPNKIICKKTLGKTEIYEQ